MKISYALNGFLDAKAADGYSLETLAMYKWGLSLLGNFLADKEIEAVTHLEIQQFFGWLRDGYIPTRRNLKTGPLTPRSIENIWTAMRSFFNWLTSEGYVTERPDHKIARPRYEKRQIQPFTQEEIAAMPSPRLRLLRPPSTCSTSTTS
jgi:site-specific recombinase XerD